MTNHLRRHVLPRNARSLFFLMWQLPPFSRRHQSSSREKRSRRRAAYLWRRLAPRAALISISWQSEEDRRRCLLAVHPKCHEPSSQKVARYSGHGVYLEKAILLVLKKNGTAHAPRTRSRGSVQEETTSSGVCHGRQLHARVVSLLKILPSSDGMKPLFAPPSASCV